MYNKSYDEALLGAFTDDMAFNADYLTSSCDVITSNSYKSNNKQGTFYASYVSYVTLY